MMSNREFPKVQKRGLTPVPSCSQGRMHSSRGRRRPKSGSVLQRTLKVVVPGDLLRRIDSCCRLAVCLRIGESIGSGATGCWSGLLREGSWVAQCTSSECLYVIAVDGEVQRRLLLDGEAALALRSG